MSPGAAIVFDNGNLTLKGGSTLEMTSGTDTEVISGAFSFTDSNVDISGSSMLSKKTAEICSSAAEV